MNTKKNNGSYVIAAKVTGPDGNGIDQGIYFYQPDGKFLQNFKTAATFQTEHDAEQELANIHSERPGILFIWKGYQFF